jgi:DNA-binding response OmpR family regulator
VDDEPELRRVLVEYLTKHSFLVRAAAGGAELDALLAEDAADMLILDINMPGEDGISIARRIHAASATPILMLTAADAVVDRVVGLEIGADDYMTKPFDLRELLARVRAILRRTERGGAASPPAVPPSRSASPAGGVRFGRLTLDLDSRCLIRESGESVELTAMEFDLLHVFAQNPNRVLTRDRLLDLAHNRGTEPFDRSIDIRIARIRRKVEQDPAKPQLIRTMRGAGYMFVPDRS